MQKRILKEYNDLITNPMLGVQVEKKENEPLQWIVIITGPEGSAYEGGKFKIIVNFSENYPFKMPIFKFDTKIFHPNVSKDEGEVCQEMLGQKEWVPTRQVRGVIDILVNMLSNPNADSAVHDEAANLFRTDKTKFDETAAKFTKDYAK